MSEVKIPIIKKIIKEFDLFDETEMRIGISLAAEESKNLTAKLRIGAPLTAEEKALRNFSFKS